MTNIHNEKFYSSVKKMNNKTLGFIETENRIGKNQINRVVKGYVMDIIIELI